MKTASEMRKITEATAETEEFIVNEIERRAKEGTNAAYTPKFIKQELFNKLLSNGYKISRFTSPMEEEITRIEW